MKLHAILVAASLWPGLAAPASLPLDADRACQRLVAAAQTWQLAGAGRCGQYVCERQHQASARHVFALRWRGDGLPAAGGSNLVGYYLVDAASGAIHAWDLGEGRRGETLPRFYAKTASSAVPDCAASYRK